MHSLQWKIVWMGLILLVLCNTMSPNNRPKPIPRRYKSQPHTFVTTELKAPLRLNSVTVTSRHQFMAQIPEARVSWFLYLGRLVSKIDSVRYFESVDWGFTIHVCVLEGLNNQTEDLCMCIVQIRRWSLYLDKESREVSFIWLWNCDAVASLSLEGNNSSDFSCTNLVKVT